MNATSSPVFLLKGATEMKYPTENAMINTVPAARELRQVANFNPLKFLRKTSADESGEKKLKLDLRYKRLWFRLACPNGRMLLKPLSITDQMAVFEALVYAEKNDTEPLAKFTASSKAADVPDGNFIDDAKDKALNEALENAGFGIQLCDLVQTAGGTRYGSEIPLSTVIAAQQGAQPTPQASPMEQNPPVRKETASAKTQPAPTTPTVQKPVVTEVTEPPNQAEEAVPVTTARRMPVEPTAAAPVPPTEDKSVGEPVRQEPHADETQKTAVTAFSEETPADTPEASMSALEAAEAPKQAVYDQSATAQTVEAAPKASYTADMPVEQICERMTLEEARTFVVEGGICKGWTLAQVAEQRAPSLRFYMCSNTASNVMKAAARLVFNDMELRKAG